MDGILIIDKPEGITSHDVVARCRRILRTKKIGHTGTLDPFATGVMVVLVGRATRLAQFLDKDAKSYAATVRLGFETDTGDRTGAPKEPAAGAAPHAVTAAAIEAALPAFRGRIMQTPPMYSAKKIDGRKLYELARKGVEVARQPVEVTISELALTGGPDEESAAAAGGDDDGSRPATRDFRLAVTCSAGTYIRVLAEDLGRALGTGAHLAELRRTRAGRFGLERAVTLEELEELAEAGRAAGALVAMNDAVGHLAALALDEAETAKIKNGMKLRRASAEFADGALVRLTSGAELVAIGFFAADEKTVQPKVVLV